MNQSSCCCGDSEFMDAAYYYYYPNRRCFKSDCAACPYTASALSRDVEHCFCHSSCTPGCSSDCNSCCCSISGLSDAAQTDAQDADGCAGIACKKDSCAVTRRLCCDRDGGCCLYPESCRDNFWPEFAHPRWLCCKDLYSGQSHYNSCHSSGCDCEETDD